MCTAEQLEVVVVVDPPEQREGPEQGLSRIDENDLPSSSRSMSLLIEEAVAAIEKYPEGENYED